MKFEPAPLEGAYVVTLEPFGDERGYFARQFCEREFAEHGMMTRVVQASTAFNVSGGTLRGLHYQLAPKAESKLVRCIRGSVHDVIVDLRRDSPTLGEYFARELSARNRQMMYVPKGFAHGFLTLEDNSELVYLMDEFYAPEAERGIRWNDERFSIAWPNPPKFLSDKDATQRDFDPDWHLGE